MSEKRDCPWVAEANKNRKGYKHSYEFNDKPKRYIPDLYIEYKDGSWAIVEVKPEYQLDWPSTIAKLDAAEAQLPDGCFEVWCEAELVA